MVEDGKSAPGRMLLNSVVTHSFPDGAPKGIPVPEYFSGLWLVARLVRRHVAKFLPHLPDRCHPPADVLPAGLRGKLEMLRIEQRIAPVSAAMWLLEDWPDRFITTAKAAGITGEDFIRTESSYPPWLEYVLREHFLQQNKWLGREEVAKAVLQLTAGGLKVSKNALRRTLGVSENWAINELLDQRRKATVGELNALCKKFEKLIQITPAARDQQRTLARDFLILLVSAFAKRKIEEVCRMSRNDVAQILLDSTGAEAKGPPMKSAKALLLRLHDQYAHGIRPHFVVRGEQPKTWFLSRFGVALDGHSVRDQIAKLMKHEFDPALWCSADVFQGAATRQLPRRRPASPRGGQEDASASG